MTVTNLNNLDFIRFSRPFMRKLPLREHRRKDRSVNAVFLIVILAKLGVSVRTPLAYVSRIAWHFSYE